MCHAVNSNNIPGLQRAWLKLVSSWEQSLVLVWVNLACSVSLQQNQGRSARLFRLALSFRAQLSLKLIAYLRETKGLGISHSPKIKSFSSNPALSTPVKFNDSNYFFKLLKLRTIVPTQCHRRTTQMLGNKCIHEIKGKL